MMDFLIVLMLLGVACAYTVDNKADVFVDEDFKDVLTDESWYQWKMGHNKVYENEGVEKVRFIIWQDNIRRINEHNKRNKDLVLKINHFGDLTNTEFGAMMNGYLHSEKHRNASTFLAPSNMKAPDSVDWRQEGYVTPVKNQGHCGSCWAFSTTGSLEGQNFKKTGKLSEISEQNLVDCSASYGNNGCEGGLMDNAFQYIKDNGGIDSEASYPYTGVQGSCHFKKANVVGRVSGFVDITEGNEDDLKDAVASVGPVSVAIDASNFSFQFYHTGVYDEANCSSEKLDHGVLVVGYGVDEGKDYWLVKNSWGTTWGLQGYIQMSRNKNNQCGIASKASYPLV